jgi:phage replication-related protein YjqB (UPF0714/DUF867 family)
VFADLLAQPGVVEHIELRSTFGFMAFHGGSLEQMTDVIAIEAADRAGASLYAVVQPPELRWHIPSRLVTPDASPNLRAFLDHVEVAVALHGYGREGRWTDILVGGGNRDLAAVVAQKVAEALPDYTLVGDLHHVPAELRGLHPDNPVNQVRAGACSSSCRRACGASVRCGPTGRAPGWPRPPKHSSPPWSRWPPRIDATNPDR